MGWQHSLHLCIASHGKMKLQRRNILKLITELKRRLSRDSAICHPNDISLAAGVLLERSVQPGDRGDARPAAGDTDD